MYLVDTCEKKVNSPLKGLCRLRLLCTFKGHFHFHPFNPALYLQTTANNMTTIQDSFIIQLFVAISR